MAKTKLKPSTALYLVSVVLVSCGTMEKPNIITTAWAGTICSDPPMIGISVRPSRYSHSLIKATSFTLNNREYRRIGEIVGYYGFTAK